MGAQSFVRVYASPGIDSTPDEQGIVSSGAGNQRGHLVPKPEPSDWRNESAAQGGSTETLVGNFPVTKAPNPTSLKVRRRGMSPWGGLFHSSVKIKQPAGRPGGARGDQHPQGNADMNPGAGAMIAGGKGAASMLVRLRVRDPRNRQAMKLPVLPDAAQRSGPLPLPSGGGTHGLPAATLTPKIPGLGSIFGFVKGGQ